MAKVVLRIKTDGGFNVTDTAEVNNLGDMGKLLRKSVTHLAAIRRLMPELMETEIKGISLGPAEGQPKPRAAAAAS